MSAEENLRKLREAAGLGEIAPPAALAPQPAAEPWLLDRFPSYTRTREGFLPSGGALAAARSMAPRTLPDIEADEERSAREEAARDVAMRSWARQAIRSAIPGGGALAVPAANALLDPENRASIGRFGRSVADFAADVVDRAPEALDWTQRNLPELPDVVASGLRAAPGAIASVARGAPGALESAGRWISEQSPGEPNFIGGVGRLGLDFSPIGPFLHEEEAQQALDYERALGPMGDPAAARAAADAGNLNRAFIGLEAASAGPTARMISRIAPNGPIYSAPSVLPGRLSELAEPGIALEPQASLPEPRAARNRLRMRPRDPIPDQPPPSPRINRAEGEGIPAPSIYEPQQTADNNPWVKSWTRPRLVREDAPLPMDEASRIEAPRDPSGGNGGRALGAAITIPPAAALAYGMVESAGAEETGLTANGKQVLPLTPEMQQMLESVDPREVMRTDHGADGRVNLSDGSFGVVKSYTLPTGDIVTLVFRQGGRAGLGLEQVGYLAPEPVSPAPSSEEIESALSADDLRIATDAALGVARDVIPEGGIRGGDPDDYEDHLGDGMPVREPSYMSALSAPVWALMARAGMRRAGPIARTGASGLAGAAGAGATAMALGEDPGINAALGLAGGALTSRGADILENRLPDVALTIDPAARRRASDYAHGLSFLPSEIRGERARFAHGVASAADPYPTIEDFARSGERGPQAADRFLELRPSEQARIMDEAAALRHRFRDADLQNQLRLSDPPGPVLEPFDPLTMLGAWDAPPSSAPASMRREFPRLPPDAVLADPKRYAKTVASRAGTRPALADMQAIARRFNIPLSRTKAGQARALLEETNKRRAAGDDALFNALRDGGLLSLLAAPTLLSDAAEEEN